MKTRFKPGIKISQGIRTFLVYRKVWIAASAFGLAALSMILLLNLGSQEEARAAGGSETLSAGAFIVNMGVTTQTTANGLKPYGLIYDLIQNYQVPVKWIIESTKAKDGTDFTYNSVSYKGGPFIIEKEFITLVIAARISYWQTQGVQGVYTTSAVTVPVYATITSFPNIMIDTLSSLQNIVTNYYANAGIPSSAYSLGSPSGLNQCHDIWTNPHGDPTWATHNYLYNFVTVQKSFIWAECHSVSMMESCKNPGPPYQQLNFLTTNGLQCWGSGWCGSITETHALSATAPFNYYHSGEPIMQFMGNMELSTQAGSERWYIPVTTGGWNAASYRGVTTGSTTSPREGVLLVFGRAYGNDNYGMVMYEAGHDLTSGGGGGAQPHKVSSQRAYFNFLLLAGRERRLKISASFPSAVSQGQSYPVTASTHSGTAPFTYRWRSSMGGSFANENDSSTTYTAPIVVKDTTDVIQVKVTDQCGKISFEYRMVPLKVNPLPVDLLSFTGDATGDSVDLKWITASEVNNNFFTLFRSVDGEVYFELARKTGHGTTSVQHSYSFSDGTAPIGMLYYRLSQTDYDGSIKVYDPIAVNNKSGNGILGRVAVLPNPFKEKFQVSITSPSNQKVTISIHQLNGALIDQKIFTAKKGPNLFDYDRESDLKPGIYLAGIKTESGNSQFIKIIHQ